MVQPSPPTDAQAELEAVRARLREAEYLLDAIQSGKADALIINGSRGEEVFTLKSLDVLLDSIIDHSLGASVLVDRDGVVKRASQAALGLRQGGLLGLRFDEAFPLVYVDEDTGGSAARFSIHDVLSGTVIEGREVSYARPDGTSFTLVLAAKPLTPFGGLFQGAVVNLLDITPRRKAELQALVRQKQLKYHLELTKTITDNTAEALILTDATGHAVLLNPAALAMLGHSPADLAGMDLHHALHPQHAGDPASAASCPLGELLESPLAIGAREDVFTAADGRRIPVRFSKAPVFDDGEVKGAVLSVGDVSQRNETEAALRLSEEKLRQSQKMEAVGRLAGGIAHDFNNLLTAINGYCTLILEGMPGDDPNRAFLGEIHKAGERAASLTSQLLAYSRKQILAPKTVNLNQLAEETLSILRRTLGETIDFHVDLHDEPCPAKVDPAHIQQVLINLAINARDAMPEGGTLRVTTRIAEVIRTDRTGLVGEMAREMDGGLQPGAYALVTIADTGHGMDERVKSHLFEPFFTTKEVGKGTGLGLSMAYGIVKQSGGHIQVYSEPGRGTTVKIYLPLAREPEGERSPAEPRTRVHGGTETLLLVEDEDAVLKLMRQVLADRGYRVIEARNGLEALALAEAHAGPIDLLITDMVMGGMGGLELARRLKTARPETRRMFISGYTRGFDLSGSLEEDDTVFLQKPFSPDTLARTVRGTLDRGKPRA